MFEGDHILNLIEFCANPWVILIAVGVEAGERLKPLLDVAVVDEPSVGAC